MSGTVDRAAVECALATVEAAAQALRELPPWRIFRALELIHDIRAELRKAMTLARQNGSILLDVRWWLPSILLALFPFDLLAKILLLFGVVTATIAGALTTTEFPLRL